MIITFKDLLTTLHQIKSEAEELGLDDEQISNMPLVKIYNAAGGTKISRIEFKLVSDGKGYYVGHADEFFKK